MGHLNFWSLVNTRNTAKPLSGDSSPQAARQPKVKAQVLTAKGLEHSARAGKKEQGGPLSCDDGCPHSRETDFTERAQPGHFTNYHLDDEDVLGSTVQRGDSGR